MMEANNQGGSGNSELEQLRRENDKLHRKLIEAGQECHAEHNRAESAERDLAEARKDGERLDFLTLQNVEVWEMNGYWWLKDYRTAGDPEAQQFKTPRAAIDAARKEKP